MAKGQKAVPVDDYIYQMLTEMVEKHMAKNLAEAIGKSAAKFLNRPYYTRKEIEFQQRMAADKVLVDIIDDPHHGKAEMDEIIRLAHEKYGNKQIDVPKDF